VAALLPEDQEHSVTIANDGAGDALLGRDIQDGQEQIMWHLPKTLREIEDAGDATIVPELIDSFQNDTARRFKRLHDAVARLDAATVRAEAHSVRGSADQMGAEALADLCQAVETCAPRMNWRELEGQLEQADMRFAEVRNAMSEFVKTRWRASS
jgi:HPt (histidine-containing phosphotransfer) domain-containing protein